MPLIEEPNPRDPRNGRYTVLLACAVIIIAAVFVFIGT